MIKVTKIPINMACTPYITRHHAQSSIHSHVVTGQHERAIEP